MSKRSSPTPGVCALLCLLLAGCDSRSTIRVEQVVIISDPLNGCQYIREAGNITSLTPRLGPDGKQVCK